MASSSAAALILILLAGSGHAAASVNRGVMSAPGALSINCRQVAYDFVPTFALISPNGKSKARLYAGVWWSKETQDPSRIRAAASGIEVPLGQAVAGVTPDSKPGLLPLLDGAGRFYIEFRGRLTDEDPDHHSGFWLLPIEHNSRQDDHYAGDRAGYERFLELDVEESSFSPGNHGVAIDWRGNWPKYERRFRKGDTMEKLDRTAWHDFGLSYDGFAKRVAWWVDGRKQREVSGSDIPDIARRQHFYPIVDAGHRGANKLYSVILARLSACVG